MSDQTGDHFERSRHADGRLRSAYWELRGAIRLLTVEIPRFAYRDGRESLAWLRDLLTGDAPGLGYMCGVADCQRDAVTRLTQTDRHGDRRPICARHFLAIYAGLALTAVIAVAALAVIVGLTVVILS